MIPTYNKMIVFLIPDLIEVPGHPFEVLPVGIHEASLQEIAETFAFNSVRRELFDGLQRGAYKLRTAGCLRIYVDGSFVTSKPLPGDFDACYELAGINRSLLDPLFEDFGDGRAAQKREFGGEFFPANWRADDLGRSFIDFFQTFRDGDTRKGILVVSLQAAR